MTMKCSCSKWKKVKVFTITKPSFWCHMRLRLWGRSLLVRKVVNLLKEKKIQLKVKNLCPPSHFPKTCNGIDWSLCGPDSGPRVLYLTPLIYIFCGALALRVKFPTSCSLLFSACTFEQREHSLVNRSIPWIHSGLLKSNRHGFEGGVRGEANRRWFSQATLDPFTSQLQLTGFLQPPKHFVLPSQCRIQQKKNYPHYVISIMIPIEKAEATMAVQ